MRLSVQTSQRTEIKDGKRVVIKTTIGEDGVHYEEIKSENPLSYEKAVGFVRPVCVGGSCKIKGD